MSVDPRWIRNPSDELAIEQGCYFDEEAGAFVCDFIEVFCKQSKGKWSGKPITLLDWQRDLIMRLFGWMKADGKRRFRRCYVEVAKKNGKSTLVSALTLYLILADGEGAPEVYLNACDRNQARIVFDEAARMVRSSPELSQRLQPIDTRHRIVSPSNNGVIIANSADAPNKDGLNPSAVIFDELHRQPNTSLWDVFEYAAAAREQPLTISITTAGEDDAGVWHEQRNYSEQVNRGEVPDVTHLGVVYRADPAADLDAPDTWRAANPSLGVTISEEDFARELAEARETPRKLAGFMRLRLNVISSSDVVFIPAEQWEACSGPAVIIPKFRGKACWMGGDLSTTTDLTATATIFGDIESGFDVLMRFWLPEENIIGAERRDRQNYRYWVRQGYLKLTEGNVIDYESVRAEVNDQAAEFDLRKLSLDPYNATQLGLNLQNDGIAVEFLRQGYLSVSPPTKELERLVLSRKLRHGGNPILKWMASNAVASRDEADNVKLSKKKSRCRIDGMSALVNAIAAATSDEEAGPSVYETRGLLTL